MFYNKLTVRVDLAALAANYRLLREAARRDAPQVGAMPVVKADAYGHGLAEVGRALYAEGARRFAVGTVEEAAALLDALQEGAWVLALLGAQDKAEAEACAGRGIVPVVYEAAQLDLLDEAAAGRQAPLDLAVKVDTGMARLGFAAGGAEALARDLARRTRLRPALVMSHLAAADEPDLDAYTSRQAEAFARVMEVFRQAGHAPRASLANSAGILTLPPGRRGDVVRPGIALYGANPLEGTPKAALGQGLKEAMTVTAPVLQVRDLPAGASISYGCAFTAARDMRVAVVGAGYADCYSRGLTNKGAVCLHGTRAPIVGRVCMQMTAVDVTHIPRAARGDAVHLLGGEGSGAVTVHDLAAWWGTIPYEVFCLLGQNRRTCL